MTAPATVEDSLAVQYWDSGLAAWVQFGSPCDFGSYLRTRRIALGPGRSVTTSKIRVVKVGAYDWGTDVATIEAVQVRKEQGAAGVGRLWTFTFDSADQQYMLVASDQNAEVYRRGVHCAAVPHPYLDGQISVATRAQSLDTMLTFHRDVPPNRITRQGAEDEWDSRAIVFANVPPFDYLGTHLGGTNEEQEIRFKSYVNGDTFNIAIEGNITNAITYSTTAATMIANLKAAIEALPNIGAGGTTITNTATNIYKVVFIGSNAAQDLGEMAPVTLDSASGGVFAATLKQGSEGGEPIFSATRGYPSAGAFYQQRLFMAGLKSQPQTIIASRLGFYFDLQIKGQTDDKAISVTIDTDAVTRIIALYPGRHLQVFTASSEFYFPSEPIVPPPAIKQTSRRGTEPGTPQFEMGGATMFIAAGGGAVCEYLYDFATASYGAGLVSTLASHLVKNVVDLGFRRARSTIDQDLALLVRADGGGTLMSALREQEVTGFSSFTTQGQLLAAAGEMNGDIYMLVKRGAQVMFERLDESRMLDSSVRLTGAQTVVAVPHLAGMTACLYIDGADAGDVVVPGDGNVVLPYPSVRSVEVGLLFQPKGRLLPPVLQQDQRGGATIHGRVGTIEFDLGPTANLKAGLAGGRMWTVPLKHRPNALLDQGPGENAFEGWTRIQGVPGFSGDAQVEWIQERPGPLTIKQIVATVTS